MTSAHEFSVSEFTLVCAVSFIHDLFGHFTSEKEFADALAGFEPGLIFPADARFSLRDEQGGPVVDAGPEELTRYMDPRWTVVCFSSHESACCNLTSEVRVAEVLTMRPCRSCGFLVDPSYQLELLMEGCPASGVFCEKCWAWVEDGTFVANFPSVGLTPGEFVRSARFMRAGEVDQVLFSAGARQKNKMRMEKATRVFEEARDRTRAARAQILDCAAEMVRLQNECAEFSRKYINLIANDVHFAIESPVEDEEVIKELIEEEKKAIIKLAKVYGVELLSKNMFVLNPMTSKVREHLVKFENTFAVFEGNTNKHLQLVTKTLNLSISSYNCKVDILANSIAMGYERTLKFRNFHLNETVYMCKYSLGLVPLTNDITKALKDAFG